MKNIILSEYISWDDNNKVRDMLDRHIDIDLIYDDGIFFKLAVKHNNVQIVEVLLKYLDSTTLQDLEIDNIEYKVVKNKISVILQDAENSFEVSEEMQQIIAPYLPNDDEDSQADNFSEDDDKIIQELTATGNSSNNSDNPLTLDNLQKLASISFEDKFANIELAGHHQEDTID